MRVGNAVASDDARRHKGDTCLRATPHRKHYVGLRWGPQNSKTNAQEEEIQWLIVRFLHKYLQMSDIFRTFATSKVNGQQKSNDMEATLRTNGLQATEKPLINPDWRNQQMHSHEEFWNMAYADLGKRYGLNDIREAK